jgi:5-formyltetrahydrofolate cyclo-ligase
VEEGIDAALKAAGPDGIVVIFGSLYLAGDVRSAFQARLKAAKATQRAVGRAARRGLTPTQRAEKSAAICKKLTELPEMANAGIIFSYLAMPEEVELSAFHEWARANGKQVAFPLTGKHSHMEIYIPGPEGGMVQDRYGISAPDPAKSTLVDPRDVDVVIVPMVGFDKNNNRLGQGGGYYDRYLTRCSQAKRIAVAFAEQEFDQVVTDFFDMPMDMVVTDK